LSIANPGAIDPVNIIQNPIVTEEGLFLETPPRRVTRSMVRAASPSNVPPAQPAVDQSRRGRLRALVETGEVQPLPAINQPVTPSPFSEPLPIVAPTPVYITNVHPISVVSSPTVPPAPITVSNVAMQQNNIIGGNPQPISSVVQNPFATLPVTIVILHVLSTIVEVTAR
jgi:hypothetical protein